MAPRFFNPFAAFFDSTPNVLSGAQLFFYEAGTSTKLDTYPSRADAIAETNANSNPIVLNSAGRPDVNIFLKAEAYKVVLAPATDSDPPTSPIWTADDFRGIDLDTVSQMKVGDGAPTGSVSGTAGSAGVLPTTYWDFTNNIHYFCTASGDAASAVWTAINASAATPSVPQPQGRLTLVSDTPVITSNQASKTSVFYTPYTGNLVPIYNGSSFTPTEFSELSLTLVAAHALNTIYDLFVFSNSGVLTLVTGPAWNNSAAGAGNRGTGSSTTELARVSGLLTNAVQITGRNGNDTFTINANRATYVGTILIDGTAGQVTCNLGFGQSRVWGVWNAYNRVPIVLQAGDSTASWAYVTDTWRASNNDSDNSMTILSGLQEEVIELTFTQATEQAGSNRGNVGIGWNSTSTPSGRSSDLGTTASALFAVDSAQYVIPGGLLGISVATSLEKAVSGSVTFYGSEAEMLLLGRWRG